MKINASTTDEEILTMNDCERDECHCVIVASNLLELCNQREAARRHNTISSLRDAHEKECKGKVEKLKELLKNHFLYKGLIIDFFDEIFGEKK